jgi:hypothetical protein
MKVTKLNVTILVCALLMVLGGAARAQSSEGFWHIEGNVDTDANFHYLGTADDRPLVIKTNGQERMRISDDIVMRISAAGQGVQVSAGGTGVQVSDAGGHGVHVEHAKANGVSVAAAGQPSTTVAWPDPHNGFAVAGAEQNGLFVGRADMDGVRVESAADDGVQVGTVGTVSERIQLETRNGFEVEGAEGNGLAIGRAELFGVNVQSAGLAGVWVESSDGQGIVVNHAVGDGVSVNRAGNPSTTSSSNLKDGFEVAGAEGNGLYVGRADNMGVVINSAGVDGVRIGTVVSDGIVVGSVGGDGIRVENAGRYAGDFHGTVRTEILEITGGSDLAEPFPVAGPVEPGMVVAIAPEHPGHLRLAAGAYDRTVVGVVSGANGVNPGLIMQQEGSVAAGSQPVALSGRVYVWADASYGAIQPGDLLTTSSTPGHAMKVTDFSRAQGAILGKAMSGLEEGRGLVLVLVSLQ